MKEYYVDVENVGTKWIDIYKEMGKSDKMVLYFSKNTHFGYQNLMLFLQSKDLKKLELKEAFVRGMGDSALDYYLMGDMQNNMTKNPKREYILVSNDKDYDDFIKIKQNDGYNVLKMSTNNQINNICVDTIEMEFPFDFQPYDDCSCKNKNERLKLDALEKIIDNCFTKNKIIKNEKTIKNMALNFLKSNGNFKLVLSDFEGKEKNTISTSITRKDRTEMKNIISQ